MSVPGSKEEQLGLHFLGELDVYRSDAVHRHLRHCGRCAAKAEEIVEVLAALALGAEYDDAAPAHRLAGSPQHGTS